MPRGIIVFGANGSGKTTLGRELARILDYKRMDVEDYYFDKSDIFYASPRPREEVIARMLADIHSHGSFVISAVTGDFGEEIAKMYELAIWLSAPIDIRLKRIETRDYAKYGERTLEGGDMYESRKQFRDFVAARSLEPIELWARTLTCPVVRVDGEHNYREAAERLARKFLSA